MPAATNLLLVCIGMQWEQCCMTGMQREQCCMTGMQAEMCRVPRHRWGSKQIWYGLVYIHYMVIVHLYGTYFKVHMYSTFLQFKCAVHMNVQQMYINPQGGGHLSLRRKRRPDKSLWHGRLESVFLFLLASCTGRVLFSLSVLIMEGICSVFLFICTVLLYVNTAVTVKTTACLSVHGTGQGTYMCLSNC
jgi:hypothetical protein